jgi:hypothetical protein
MTKAKNQKINTFLLFFGLLFNANSFGQSIPFPQPGMEQGDVYVGNWTMPGTPNASIIYLKDTVINSQTYSHFQNKFNSDFYTWQLGGKIYFDWANGDGSLVGYYDLLYDFNLSIGDTFYVNPLAWGNHTIVDTTYMITLLNGQQRKYIRLHDISSPSIIFQWIDGIGDIENGFLVYNDFEGGHTQFVCAKDSSGMLLTNLVYNYDCDSLIANKTTSVHEIEIKNHSTVYPNPFISSSTLEMDPKVIIQNLKFQMTDVFGRKVQELKITESKLQIERGSLPNGIYFYKITSEGIIISTGKLVTE